MDDSFGDVMHDAAVVGTAAVVAEPSLSPTPTVRMQIVEATSRYDLVTAVRLAAGIVVFVVVAAAEFAVWRKKPAFFVLCPSMRPFQPAIVGSIP